MKRQYLTFSQRVAIYNFIKTVGKANGEHWEYAEGWSDKRVAEQFKSSVGNVSTVRLELGKLMTGTGAPYSIRLGELETKVEEVKKDCDYLKQSVNDLISRINKLALKEHFGA
jgi:hypothetical protein